MVDKQKLNIKIVKWLRLKGWTWEADYLVDHHGYSQTPFTDSMDACIERIAPKLHDYGLLEISFHYSVLEGFFPPFTDKDKWGFHVRVHLEKYLLDPFDTYAKTVPLAFCLAVEKLIDSEVSNG